MSEVPLYSAGGLPAGSASRVYGLSVTTGTHRRPKYTEGLLGEHSAGKWTKLRLQLSGLPAALCAMRVGCGCIFLTLIVLGMYVFSTSSLLFSPSRCTFTCILHSKCKRWRSNPSGKCSQQRLTRGTVTSTMRRAAHPSGCAR